jgi:dsDNA-specific endonuclease/ATPase MutS2
MGSRRHSEIATRFAVRLLLACVFVIVAAANAYADPDYKELKAEIQKLEKAVENARKERNDADAKLAENLKAQEKAKGEELTALKKTATGLRDTAKQKADALSSAVQNLAAKQGELRETAAAHAVKQLSDAGDIDVRVGEATNALNDWRAALGSLPEVPPLLSEGIEDIDDRMIARKDDKRKLEAYEKWAGAEEARIDKEIKQAKELVDGESTWKASNDGGAAVTSTAKSLKTTLETRKKDVGELRKSAKELVRQIK